MKSWNMFQKKALRNAVLDKLIKYNHLRSQKDKVENVFG